MDILIVAIETGRWGPARLPGILKHAGLSVAVLCPADNALAATDFADRRFVLPATRSGGYLAAAIAAAIRDCNPKLLVPADEQVVALLHTLVHRKSRALDTTALSMIVRSLGQPDRFDAMLLKSDTLALARRLGVAVPEGGTVRTPTDAIALAERIGYPVFLKSAFGWAGQGVTRCDGPDALRSAFPKAPSPVKSLLRRLAGRDWYPNAPTVDVQAAINGTPAMYCAVAWHGKILAGFAGIARETTSAQGPSSVVWIGAHPAMAEAAERMIAAYGATGFIGFDFMLDDKTGTPLLLECNPRPIQVCHLGSLIGVDLARALANAMAGHVASCAPPEREVVVALFPHAARRDDFEPDVVRDVAMDDAGLRRYAGLPAAEGDIHATPLPNPHDAPSSS